MSAFTSLFEILWVLWHNVSGCPVGITPRQWVDQGNFDCPCPPDRHKEDWEQEAGYIENAHASIKEACHYYAIHMYSIILVEGYELSLDLNKEGLEIVTHTLRIWDNNNSFNKELAARVEKQLRKAASVLTVSFTKVTGLAQLNAWLNDHGLVNESYGYRYMAEGGDWWINQLTPKQRWNCFGERDAFRTILQQ